VQIIKYQINYQTIFFFSERVRMEEDDLNIAVGDKLEQEGNNLEDEYGYEDEEFVGQEDE